MMKYSITPRQVMDALEAQPFKVLRPVIVLGVLLLVGAISYAANKLGLTYVLILTALFPAVGGLILIIRYPVIGLIFTLLGGIFIPFTGPSGINVTVFGVVLLIGVWVFKMMMEDRKFSLVTSRTILPILLFFLSAIISFVLGQLSWYPFAKQAPVDAQVGGLVIFLLSGGVFLVIPHIITEIKPLQLFTWIFLAFGGIYMVGRAINIAAVDSIFDNGFIANSMFWTWLVAMAFSQVLLNNSLRLPMRILLVSLLLITGYVAYVINGDWKSGYLPALVAVGTIVFLKYPKFVILLSPFALAGAYWIVSQAVATDEYSWVTRLDAWMVILEMVKISPLLGMGFANYSFYTTVFNYRGWYLRWNSHSQYVDILAQTGLIGLVIFFWIIFEVAWLGWRLRKEITGGFSRAYVDGVLGGIAGTLAAAFLVDWILPFAYNIGFYGFRASVLPWIFFGGLVVIEQVQNRNVSISRQPASVD